MEIYEKEKAMSLMMLYKWTRNDDNSKLIQSKLNIIKMNRDIKYEMLPYLIFNIFVQEESTN